jgi:hypothetical protein
MIPIYNETPTDWKDLETKVSKIFSDIGFNVEVEKNIKLARGIVNVDVFAERKYLSSKEIHIAECKYWTEAVPKHVVHSVRTILNDSGANSGYIISKNGFQKGSYDAAQYSNLNLLTFNEFQTEFRTRWIDNVIDELENVGYPLRKYTDPMESYFWKHIDSLSPTEKEEFNRLAIHYRNIAIKSARFLYKNPVNGQLELEWFDQTINQESKDLPKEISINCLMDYFQFLKDYCTMGVKEIDEIFGKPLRKT